jgi:thioredoxin reductase (NADPH)
MYDFVIIGGGPAGLSAAVYAARFKLNVVVLARELGGTLMNAHFVENWPGEKGLPGAELAMKMQEQVENLGVEIKQTGVKKIDKKDSHYTLITDSEEYEAKSILLATGTKHRHLEVPGEEDFYGKGVSYCAVCDGAFFKDKTVAVIGGSDSAAKEALFLSEHASKVYIIYRKDKLRAEPINAERVEKNPKIEVINNTNITEIKGDKFVTGVNLDNPHKGSDELELQGVFIEIGYDPQNDLTRQLGLDLDERGQIKIDEKSGTNIPGVYAAGDITSGGFNQAIMASAQGVMAAYNAYRFIKKSELEEK